MDLFELEYDSGRTSRNVVLSFFHKSRKFIFTNLVTIQGMLYTTMFVFFLFLLYLLLMFWKLFFFKCC
jgi:hypothetical protein